MPRIGAYEVRSMAVLNARGELPAWCSLGEEATLVVIGVLRLVCRQPVRGEQLGAAHLLASPPQTHLHTMPEPVAPEDLPTLLLDLARMGYRVDLQPINRPISLLELMMLRGEIAPDPEPVEVSP